MKYSIGEKIEFNYDFYEVYNNVELEYDHTERLYGTIIEVNKDKKTYTVKTDIYEYPFIIKEKDIITKTSILNDTLMRQKIKIANITLEIKKAKGELLYAIQEYNEIEKIIERLNGK